MSLNVDNCRRCGRVYVKNIHGMCPNCVKDIEAQYEKCVNYLREYRQCNIYDLSEATGVEVKQIIKFIREGRISIKNHANMSYDCEICGTPIKEHAICESCRTRLLKDKANMQEDEQRQKEQTEQVSFRIKDRLQNRNK